MMIFHKFDFSKHIRLKEPDFGIELCNILNIALLFIVLFFLNSRFILSPGLAVSLPTTEHTEAQETMGVLTVQSEKFIMIGGEIFSLSTLSHALKEYLQNKNLAGFSVKNILVRADRSVPIELMIKICDILRSAGYENIQIATSNITAY